MEDVTTPRYMQSTNLRANPNVYKESLEKETDLEAAPVEI